MAAIRGCYGAVYVGSTLTATGSTAAVADVTSWEYQVGIEKQDSSVMGDCTKSYTAGPAETSGTITCNWAQDPVSSADAEQLLLGAAGNKVKIVLYPAGNSVGKRKLTGLSALIENASHSADVNGFIKSTFNFTLDGAFTAGTVT